jgi:hypothetical protein
LCHVSSCVDTWGMYPTAHYDRISKAHIFQAHKSQAHIPHTQAHNSQAHIQAHILQAHIPHIQANVLHAHSSHAHIQAHILQARQIQSHYCPTHALSNGFPDHLLSHTLLASV